MTKIIAFAGRKQSGKTTCSEFVASKYIEKSFGHKSKIYNFADPLKKDICISILGLTNDQCYGSDDHKNALTNCYWEGNRLTAREVMQFVGTNIFRQMKQDVWVSATINKIYNDKFPLAIIADCRFPNEVEAIKEVGGIVIKLTRNPFNSNHESETALDSINYADTNFNYVIDNNNLSISDQNDIINQILIKEGILTL
jgi:hypothetical protein